MDVIVSQTDMRDLHRQCATLYKTVSALVSGYESPEHEWTTRKEIDNKNEPHRYFRARFGDKSISIHLTRSELYTLECYGFQPRSVRPFNAKHGRYKNYFGSFENLSQCLVAFSKEVYNLCLDYAGVLF